MSKKPSFPRRREPRFVRIVWKWIAFAPAILLLGTFAVFPIVQALAMSFTDAEFLNSQTHIVGLANYAELLSDTRFWLSIRATLVFVAGSVLLQFAIGLTGAICLNAVGSGPQRGIRSLLLLPYTLSELVAGILWYRILDSQYGIANGTLSLLGVQSQNWLTGWAPCCVIVVNVWWGATFSLLLFEAALKSIPDSWYESAAVDGASTAFQFRHITVPALKYVAFLDLVYITLFTLNTFGIIFVLTFGGPEHSTEVLGLFMWIEAFRDFHLGYGAAISIVLFVINILLAMMYLKLFGRRVLMQPSR